jgi:hypothetical protein
MLMIEFPTFSGLHYVVEATPSLEEPARWSPLYSRVGTGTPTTFYLPMTPALQERFFRVRMY